MPPPADKAVPSEDAGLETLEADDHVDMQADERGAEEGCNMMDCGPWGRPSATGGPTTITSNMLPVVHCIISSTCHPHFLAHKFVLT